MPQSILIILIKCISIYIVPSFRIIIIIIKIKKRELAKENFAVPSDHRIKLKECEKKDKYLDLARELKNLWNMKVTNNRHLHVP